MFDLNKIKGIIFDYGGTIDSNGMHWAEVLWKAYQEVKVPVSYDVFRDAYVHGERTLARVPIIKPEHTFLDVLKLKTEIQINWLVENGFLVNENKSFEYSLAISNLCYTFVRDVHKIAIPILEELKQRYPIVMVSNFYGNLETVLKDFGLYGYFDEIVESAVVGVRKPDAAIFALGVNKFEFKPGELVVIGDSYTKDIVPATQIGCQTIWLKGKGWGDEKEGATADVVITNFSDLKEVFNL